MTKLLATLAFFFPALLAAQKYDHQWPFGYGTNLPLQFGISLLDFNGGQVSVSPFAQNIAEIGTTGSFICDKDGQLMLMTNNCAVFDRNFQVIEGGVELTPGITHDAYCPSGYYPSYQSALFLPALDNDAITYLLHKDAEISDPLQDIVCQNLYLSVIDRQPNGTFRLKEKRVLLASNMIVSQLTATLHADGTRWWVWATGYNSNTFHKFLIGGIETVQGPFSQQIGPPFFHTQVGLGQAAFSHQGNTLGINNKAHGAMLYDFDTQTGELSNYRNYIYPNPNNGTAEGLAFSPNGRFLYVSAGRDLFQLDLEDPDPVASTVHIANVSLPDETGWPIGVGYLHPGPDCRLYVSPGTTTFYIHVVHRPDEKAPDCQFEVKAIKTPTRLAFGLPNLPMYRFDGECDGNIGWGMVGTGEPEQWLEPMRAFPNPAYDLVTVTLPENHGWQALTVHDMLGREVARIQLAEGQPSISFQTAGLTSGLYFIAPLGKKDQTLKLVVKH
jgi:hypothetical protein